MSRQAVLAALADVAVEPPVEKADDNADWRASRILRDGPTS